MLSKLNIQLYYATRNSSYPPTRNSCKSWFTNVYNKTLMLYKLILKRTPKLLRNYTAIDKKSIESVLPQWDRHTENHTYYTIKIFRSTNKNVNTLRHSNKTGNCEWTRSFIFDKNSGNQEIIKREKVSKQITILKHKEKLEENKIEVYEQ